MNNKLLTILIVVIASLLMFGCATQQNTQTNKYQPVKQEPKKLILATTTSTYDTGLLDYILPDFEKKYNYEVQVISVGTGQALKNGQDGNVDVVLVHAPSQERDFVKAGYGTDRKCVMYNDFILLGPASDPAKIKGLSANDALKAIAKTKSTFISRGDNSGTYTKELSLWKAINVTAVNQSWHLETGLGMGDTLRVANEKFAYTMSDRGTYFALKNNNTDLTILVSGDSVLLNPYGVILVNATKYPTINSAGAKLFEYWLMSNETQDLIGTFQKGGEQLFHPLKGECMPGQ
jgi:tungstate transport system substrate-binding protein